MPYQPISARTLDEIEGPWGKPPDDASTLVRAVHGLRSKRIDTFSIEDLRLMLGQCVGSDHLLPLAMKVLRADPLAAGDMYEGDLLLNVLRAFRGRWFVHPETARELRMLVTGLDLGEVDEFDEVSGFLVETAGL